MEPEAYRMLISELRGLTAGAIPEGAAVLVAAKGDDGLLELLELDARHFPADADGRYAGHHPADDDWAIAHLEQLRDTGGEFLVIPATLAWWLRHYRRFADHLDSHYVVAAERQGVGIVYDIREKVATWPGPGTSVQAPTGIEAPPTGDAPATPGLLASLADELLGYGGQHRVALRNLYAKHDGELPMFAVRARGYELVDSEQRSYVDWVGAGGPVILGYGDPVVEEAIRDQLQAGPTMTLMHPVEVEVAALLKEMIPCAEMVTFGKNGSDVVNAAVRVARASTGREVVLQHGQHGFHEWYACTIPGARGIPKVLRALVHPFPYNDLEALEALFRRMPGEVAAILMEPVTSELPHPGYLEGVRELASSHGALLVFDEMVTGFRLANGGAQEVHGVTPDLACFGKALANGMPLSALVGAAEHMRILPSVAYGMTFRGETLSLAAARAVLHVLREQPVAAHLAATGERVRREFMQACAEHGVAGWLAGPDARMTFGFNDDGPLKGAEILAAFLRECAGMGVLSNGTILPSFAHDEAAIERTRHAFGHALANVAELSRAGRRLMEEAVNAAFVEPTRHISTGAEQMLPAGSLDRLTVADGQLNIAGWILLPDGPPDRIEAVSRSGWSKTAHVEPRLDVGAAFPAVAGAERAGFTLAVPARLFATDGEYDLRLRALKGDSTEFDCRIVRRPSGRRGSDDVVRESSGSVLLI